MGQKVHPYGFRLGFNRGWHSNWIAKRDYADLLHEDLKLKKELKGRFAGAGVSHIDIERAANKLKIIIHTSRPGIIIGRKGAEIDKLKQEIKERTGREVYVNIQEIHKPELNAQLQAEQIAQQLEKRIAFRRAMRRAVENAQRFGAQGIKVRVSGRLNGAEIARSEWYLQGRLPLHTLRADIDYGFAEAHTTFGVIGIKVWIYRGDELTIHRAAAARRTAGSTGFTKEQERFVPPSQHPGGGRRSSTPSQKYETGKLLENASDRSVSNPRRSGSEGKRSTAGKDRKSGTEVTVPQEQTSDTGSQGSSLREAQRELHVNLWLEDVQGHTIGEPNLVIGKRYNFGFAIELYVRARAASTTPFPEPAELSKESRKVFIEVICAALETEDDDGYIRREIDYVPGMGISKQLFPLKPKESGEFFLTVILTYKLETLYREVLLLYVTGDSEAASEQDSIIKQLITI